MRQELDDLLCQRYPDIFRDRNASKYETCMCWGFCCGDGWFDIINDLCAEITTRVAAGYMPPVVATQVKSKAGYLRFNFKNRAANPQASALVKAAQLRSEFTCEECGGFGLGCRGHPPVQCGRYWLHNGPSNLKIYYTGRRMRTLSKSKLMAYRQCPKRLWLEVHHPELRADSPAAQARFEAGYQIGDLAKQLYDPKNKGEELSPRDTGYAAAFARTKELLDASHPIFEASFTAGGALALADVLLPARKGGKRVWRMVEVKSSTSVKDYHRDDAAVQAYVARASGVPLASVALAHVDSSWVYPGGEDYQGLLMEIDLTEEAFARENEVKGWIAEAQAIAAKRKEPKKTTGSHCSEPFECGFLSHCQSQETRAEYPVAWLPGRRSQALNAHIVDGGVTDMRDVPDALLNATQQRVKKHTLSQRPFFDAASAAQDLAAHKLPAYFLDFETIQFAAPIWKGTRPYQMIPFQFSLHRLGRTCKLDAKSFLEISGRDPSRAFADALIADCGERGPVFVYNEAFEKARIEELAIRFPRLKSPLMAIHSRVVDLLPIARLHYYHPQQQGSWSIKKVLPAVAPDLRYDALEGVQDGGMAMAAFMEAIADETTASRKAEIEKQLLKYCGLDTYAMVRLWQYFSGRSDWKI